MIKKLCHTCNRIAPLKLNHDTPQEQNTYCRGSGRIYSILYWSDKFNIVDMLKRNDNIIKKQDKK